MTQVGAGPRLGGWGQVRVTHCRLLAHWGRKIGLNDNAVAL